MKVFKWIYYPVLIVLLGAFVALGFVTSTATDGKSDFSVARRAAVDRHMEKIADYGVANAGSADALDDLNSYIRSALIADEVVSPASRSNPDAASGMNNANYIMTSEEVSKPKPTVIEQRARVLPETATAMDNGTQYVNKDVYNYVVAIPGTVTKAEYAADRNAAKMGDVIMFTAHYDTSTVNAGGANSAAVANMIELIREIASSKTAYKNDFLFVFTDASLEGAVGAYAFKHQFKGFDDIYSRVKVAFNFEAVGSTGALIMSEATGNGASLVSAFAKLDGKAYTSSMTSMMMNDGKITDFDIYDDIAAYNFTTVTDENAGTKFDTYDKVPAELVNSFGNMMLSAAQYYGNADVADISTKTGAGFFDYMGGTIWYADYIAYVIGGIILLLLGGVIFTTVKTKCYNFRSIGLGAAVQVLTVVATGLCMFLVYLAVALMQVGFENINIHAITTVSTSSVGAIIFAIVFAAALSVVFYTVFKRIFEVRAMDVVRGNALIMALAAVVTCFALPEISYLFFVVAALQMAVMLISGLLGKKFKNKFGMSIERLFLYAVPVLIMMPVLCAELYYAAATNAAVWLPVFVSVFLLFGGAIMPYADYLASPIGKLVAKLPKRTVRVERTVTEKVEDKAKRGKFTEVTYKKRTKEKYTRTYSNAFGVVFVCLISIAAMTLFTAFGAGFGKGRTTEFSYADEIYKDALVYVWDDGVETLEVHDLDAYKYVARHVDGFKWNNEKNAYVMVDTTASMKLDVKPTISQDATNRKLFTVTTSEAGRSYMKLTISGFNAGSVDKVKFTFVGGREYELDLTKDVRDSYTFDLPYATESGFTFELEGDASNVKVALDQRAAGLENQMAQNHTVYKVLTSAYSAGDGNEYELTENRPSMSIVLKTTKNFSI